MQEHLKVAYTKKALELFAPIPTRKAATAEETDFTDIAALVVTEEDESIIHDRRVKAFHIPLSSSSMAMRKGRITPWAMCTE